MATLYQLAKRKGRKKSSKDINPNAPHYHISKREEEDERLTELKVKAKKGFESEKGRSQPNYYKQVAERQRKAEQLKSNLKKVRNR